MLLINDIDLGLLLLQNVKTETYMHFFTNRIVPIWNSLPEHVRAVNFGKNGLAFKKQIVSFYKQIFYDQFDPNNLCTWVSKCRCCSCRMT